MPVIYIANIFMSFGFTIYNGALLLIEEVNPICQSAIIWYLSFNEWFDLVDKNEKRLLGLTTGLQNFM